MNHARSQELQARALRRIPGGVDSPVRAFGAVGGTPPWIERGEGAYITDVDGNRYLDFICSWGALIHGHAPAAVVRAVQTAAANGTSFGASSPGELKLAELIHSAMPWVEQVRFVNSGTEAVMSAIRLARGFTRRDFLIKFAGCYHGHADAMLVQAGSGLATLALPSSAGVPAAAVANTITVPYNDRAAVEEAFAGHPGAVAALVVEPVAGNMGCVPPEEGFLGFLREITRREGALLLLDEVITGFRLGPGGAAGVFGVEPDLVTLGKIIGGGLPVGAYGGRAEIMAQVAPLGPVYQAGTLSGNPLAMAAGIAALEPLLNRQAGTYDALSARTRALVGGLQDIMRRAGTTFTIQSVGSMFTIFFGPGPIRNFADAGRCDTAAFARFHAGMLDRGILLPPSQFEAAFVSTAHTEADVEHMLHAAEAVLSA